MDILEHGIYAKNFSMLGLGDIVIPGIFIALLLRFEDRCGLGMRGRGISFVKCFLFMSSGEQSETGKSALFPSDVRRLFLRSRYDRSCHAFLQCRSGIA